MKIYIGQYATGILKGMTVVDDRPFSERKSDDLFVTLAVHEVGTPEFLSSDELDALCAEQNKEAIDAKLNEKKRKLEAEIASLEAVRSSVDNNAMFLV